MLHACHREKTSSTPDEICDDFRRVLRDRAINHSQYYRHLSATNKFTESLNNCCCQPSNSNQTDKSAANSLYHNQLLLGKLPAITKTPSDPPATASSHQPEPLMAPKPTIPRPNDDKVAVVVNHQPAILNVDKIELTDRSTGEQIDSTKVDMAMTSMVADKHAVQTASSLNATNNGGGSGYDDSDVSASSSTFAREPPSHGIAFADGNKFVSVGSGNDIVSVSALDGDNKSSVSAFSSSSVIAINNNNKTCQQHVPNHSNYSTFVRETSSLDRCCAAPHRQGACDLCLSRDFAHDQNKDLVDPFTIGEKFESEDRDREYPAGNLSDNNSGPSSSSNSPDPLNSESSVQNPGAHTDSVPPPHHLIDLKFTSTESGQIQQYYNFPCVDKLVKMYTKLLQDKKSEAKSTDTAAGEDKSKVVASRVEDCDMKSIEGLRIKDERTVDMNRNSPVSDEGCPLGTSPCSSDLDDLENDRAGKEREKVARSSSNDSALDMDEEQPMEPPPNMNTGRRMTLTVTDIPLRAALLPVPEPHSLPDSTNPAEQSPLPASLQTAVPSKVILEERLVEIPEDKFPSASNSRRESALTCLSDFDPIECGAVRYVRTPSVVVSDYSDDVLCGVTLEEIEYFRAHRMRRRSSADTNHTEKDDGASDVSAASSCSNLDYCGSTISGLDGSEYYVNGERVSIDRKVSDCSTCSTGSADDEEEGAYIQSQDYLGDEQQQKEEALQRERRKKIPVKARHPKFIN